MKGKTLASEAADNGANASPAMVLLILAFVAAWMWWPSLAAETLPFALFLPYVVLLLVRAGVIRPRPDYPYLTMWLAFMALLALGARGFHAADSHHFLGVTPFWVFAIAAAAGLTVVAARCVRQTEAEPGRSEVLGTFVGHLLLAYSLLAYLNVVLPQGHPEIHVRTVIEKRLIGQKFPSPRLILAAPDRKGRAYEVNVSGAFFDSMRVGDEVEGVVHAGALRQPWVVYRPSGQAQRPADAR